MKKLLILSFLVTAILTAKAQNTDCKVSLDSLKGTYEGDCKNGKAEGKGKATGTDTYDGDFKNGLPEGLGKYTWKNGNYYYGAWKKGLKEGKGQLHGFENGTEKLVTGYWKKDKYIGQYENPYKIISTTTEIGRVEVRNMSKKGSSISVTVKGLNDNMGNSINNSPVNITVMTDFQILKGSYNSRSNTKLTNADVTIFRDVVFPFTATFNFGNSILQIEIYEEGDWDINVPINK
jgi:hypothetical protein